MLRLELLNVKADLERSLGEPVPSCGQRRCRPRSRRREEEGDPDTPSGGEDDSHDQLEEVHQVTVVERIGDRHNDQERAQCEGVIAPGSGEDARADRPDR